MRSGEALGKAPDDEAKRDRDKEPFDDRGTRHRDAEQVNRDTYRSNRDPHWSDHATAIPSFPVGGTCSPNAAIEAINAVLISPSVVEVAITVTGTVTGAFSAQVSWTSTSAPFTTLLVFRPRRPERSTELQGGITATTPIPIGADVVAGACDGLVTGHASVVGPWAQAARAARPTPASRVVLADQATPSLSVRLRRSRVSARCSEPGDRRSTVAARSTARAVGSPDHDTGAGPAISICSDVKRVP